MEVIETQTQLDEFKAKGQLEGKVSIYPSFHYQLIPPFDGVSKFKVVVDHSFVGDNGSKMQFKAYSLFDIKTDSIPDAKFLYPLIHDAHIATLPLFTEQILLNTDILPTVIAQIKAPSYEKSLPALQVCIDGAKGAVN